MAGGMHLKVAVLFLVVSSVALYAAAGAVHPAKKDGERPVLGAPTVALGAAAPAGAGIVVPAGKPHGPPGPISSVQKIELIGGSKPTGAAGVMAAYTKLQVRNSCEAGSPIWFAASWVPYGQSGFKTDAWWKVNPCQTVYFANTRNRYFYVYAYTNAPCEQMVWSGNTRLSVFGSYYNFIQFNFGSKIINSYTLNFTCTKYGYYSPNVCCHYACPGNSLSYCA